MGCFSKAPLITLAVAVMTATCAWADNNIMSEKVVDRDKLVAIAQNKGFVKVIVRLDVPDIKELTAASTLYKKATQANTALATKIASVSGSVVSRLQLSYVSYKINHIYSTLPLLALDVSEEALDVLDLSPEVIRITKDRLIPPILDNTTTIIGADNAWAAGYTGSGWYVAILDTGIRSSHEFFSGKTIVEACFSAASHCPNGQTSMTGAGAAAHYPSTYYGWDHGTHVAGIATGNNGSLYGVARDADIIAVQVFSRFDNPSLCFPYNSCVLSYTSDLLASLNYIYTNRGTYNIASVNMSLGSGGYSDQSTCDNYDSDMKTAIDNLRAAGIATIIASGNSGYCDGVSWPACISSAIAVGAVTDGDVETYFNNWHEDLLDLFAPGDDIYSSTGDSNSSYESWSGTSMSAPHVAGAWAILRQNDSGASVDSLLSTVSSTGVSITTICSSQSGSKPRIQVDSALSLTPPTAPDSLSAATISSSQINLSWTDNSNNETGFKIERKTGAGGTWGEIYVGTTADETTYNDTGLTEVTAYYYRVRAYSTLSGDSGYSNEANATTLLNAPSNLSASAASSSQINLSWTDNSNNETGFKIERKTGAGGTWGEIHVGTTADETAYNDTGLSESITYYYRDRAYDGAGNSAYSNETNATTTSGGNGGGSSSSGGGGGGGGGCFIATAAYGSQMHPYVEALREFRDKHLLNNSYGRKFVDFYYKTSPPMAEVIRDSEFLKAITRVILTPVVMFVVYPYVSLTVFIVLLMSAGIAPRLVLRNRFKF